MNPISVLIAEDEPRQRDELSRMLTALWPEVSIVASCADGPTAMAALREKSPQIAFLDIRLPGASGVDVARAAAGKVHIVFVTAYDEYAVTAFETGAADYLLKPVTAERLKQTIARLRQRLSTHAFTDLTRLLETIDAQIRHRPGAGGLKWVTASVGDTLKMFAIEEVLFFQAQDKYVRVVTTGDEAVIRTPLKDLIPQLDPEVFWQIHRSIIVRASTIDRVHKDEFGHHHAKIKGRAEKLPISTAYLGRFRSM